MADNFRFAQLQAYSLAGSGAITGATTITLKSMTDIDGTALTMAGTFGTKGFGTLEPGNGTNEEQISFTGLTNNANGTVTLTGVKSVAFVYPYTETSGLLKTHPGSTTFVISNTSGFYDKLTSKSDDETVEGTWTFTNPNYPQIDVASPLPTLPTQFATLAYVNSVAIAGAPDATLLTKGIVQLPTQAQTDARTVLGSTGAALVITPDKVRSTLLSDYVMDTGTTNSILIAPSPVITAYTSGQIFTTRVAATNTASTSINVNSLGAKFIKRANGSTELVAGDIAAGQMIVVQYDGAGDRFQLLSPIGRPQVSTNGQEIYAASSTGNDTYVITLGPSPTAYTTGMVVRFKADVANTGAASLNVNNLGAVTIKKHGGAYDLTTNDIAASQISEVIYDGTNFQLQTPPNSPVVSYGTITDLTTTVAGNNDVSVTLGYQPTNIVLHYVIQGHDKSTEANTYQGMKGTAHYTGTTMTFNDIQWDGNLSGDDAAGANSVNPKSTSTPTVGTNDPGVGTGNISVTLSIPTITSTGFTIRRATTIGASNANNGRAKIAYEAFQ